MQPAALGADGLGHVRHEGDDVVLHLALDGVDAGHVERRAGADGLQRFAGDDAALGQDLGGGQLDPQPGRELVLLGPDAGHFGPGISWDQSSSQGGHSRVGEVGVRDPP